MSQLRLSHLALTLAVVFFAGCDAVDGDDLFGEFRADVTVDGDAQEDRFSNIDEDDPDQRLRGEAVYTIIETEHGREFVLGLFVGDLFDSQYDEYQFISFRRKGGIPGVGAYAVEEDPERFGVTATYANVLDADELGDRDADERARGPILYGTGGTLAITEVDPVGVVSGSFRFEALGVEVENTNRFVDGTADGEFIARYERPSLLLGRGLNL